MCIISIHTAHVGWWYSTIHTLNLISLSSAEWISLRKSIKVDIFFPHMKELLGGWWLVLCWTSLFSLFYRQWWCSAGPWSLPSCHIGILPPTYLPPTHPSLSHPTPPPHLSRPPFPLLLPTSLHPANSIPLSTLHHPPATASSTPQLPTPPPPTPLSNSNLPAVLSDVCIIHPSEELLPVSPRLFFAPVSQSRLLFHGHSSVLDVHDNDVDSVKFWFHK